MITNIVYTLEIFIFIFCSLNVFKNLYNMIKVKAKVLRDGKKIEIDSKNLVLGDIVFLESGDKIRITAAKLKNETEEEYRIAMQQDFEKVSNILMEYLGKKTEIVAYPMR